jgi:hypothetical protein
MTTLFRRRRFRISLFDRGMRTSHDQKQRFIQAARDGLILILILLAFLMVVGWSQERDLADKHLAEREHIERVFVSCLEHGSAFIGGELHLCRPVNTGIKS